MEIVCNELSLDAQFNNDDDFIDSLRESSVVLSIFENLKIPVLKNSSFYNLKITSNLNLYNIIIKYARGSRDELKNLKIQLAKLIDEPFWSENNQKHTCEDIYECVYTTEKCNYGLAESIERDKVVFSFCHNSFQTSQLFINKNSLEFIVFNLKNLRDCRDMLIDRYEELNDCFARKHEELFPYITLTDKLLEIRGSYKQSLIGVSHEEKIPIYKHTAKIILRLNGWIYSYDYSNKNNRLSFYKEVKGSRYYCGLDTENGAFEIYGSDRKHIDEYSFEGIRKNKTDINRFFEI